MNAVCKLTGDDDGCKCTYIQEQPVHLMRSALISIDINRIDDVQCTFVCSTSKRMNSSETCDSYLFGVYSAIFLHFSCVFVLRTLNFLICRILLCSFGFIRFDSIRFDQRFDRSTASKSQNVCMHEMCAWVYLLPVAFTTNTFVDPTSRSKINISYTNRESFVPLE